MRAAAGLVVGLVCSTVLAGATEQRTLTFDDRVKAQRAIEQVYWNHRIWPKENPSRKPSLDAVMSDALIRSKVTDYLKKSSALRTIWQRPIAGEQLQAELERMAKGSRDPQILHELFAALGDDPDVIAETLARQTLADRLIRNWYANDTRFHGDTRAKATSALASCSSVDCMKAMGGDYRETTLRLRDSKDNLRHDPGNELILDSAEWDAALKRLAGEFGVSPDSIPLNKLSPIDETADAFVLRAVLSRKTTEIVMAAVVWQKRSFDSWWASQDLPNALDPIATPAVFKLPKLPAAGCQDDTWTPTGQDLPDSRSAHTAVWTGTEMIVWGGDNDSAEVNSGSRYDPATDRWTAISFRNAPDRRGGHSAIWTGTEMIVWGGWGGQPAFNTGGRYDPAADTWKPVSTGDNVPSARYEHAAVWTGTEMIVWGGGIQVTSVNSGGRYDPASDTWRATSVGTNTPTSRLEVSGVWTGKRMIVWGGLYYPGGNAVALNTGGIYDPTTDSWVPTSVGAQVPIGRAGHSAVWTGTQMIVWGGNGGAGATGGRYDPSTDSWAATSTGANRPSVRSLHSAVWTGTEMIVWGGVAGQTKLNSGARYDPAGDTWRAISAGANVPSARSVHTAIWTGTEMIVWGGYTQGLTTNTGGRYNPTTDSWVATSISTTVPSARVGHSTVWTGAESCVWGGISLEADVYLSVNTGGCYEPATDVWKATAIDAGTPTARKYHTAVWTGTEMIVWGGWIGTSDSDTGGRYNPITGAWSATSTGSNLPGARESHTAVWTGTEMIVWGGYVSNVGYSNSGGRYDPATGSWSPTSIPTGEPVGRVDHTAVWTGTEMIVWGGEVRDPSARELNTGGRYNPSTDFWTPTSNGVNVPGPRVNHSAVWTGHEMIIWGGVLNPNSYDEESYNTGGRYSPVTNTWKATSVGADVPQGRDEHTAVWTGLEMIVWGGYDVGYGNLSSGGRYDPASDSWLPTRSDGTTPSKRMLQSAVWTGSKMLIWGGEDYFLTSTGALYCAHNQCANDSGPVNCDDGNPCTDDSCDPATGCIHGGNVAPCDDGNVCTLNDTCSEGLCIGHSGCEDGLPCTNDRADPANGCACSNPVSSAGTACIDANRCTVGTVCDGAGGGAANCRGGALLDCNDGNPCTDDACDPAIGCIHTNNTSACDDGFACTTADACGGGNCRGGPPPDCDDGNICTDDSCDDAIGCVYTANANSCDDGNACNGSDYCYFSECLHTVPYFPCDDNNPCTTDTCDPATGACTFTNNTNSCDDGNRCNTGDVCSGGTCHAGPPVVCNDNNPCTNDICIPSTGCFFTNAPNSCDDGNECTTGDRCSGGRCQAGTPIVCNDNNPCTDDSCNPVTGCVFTPNANMCDDSDPCTSGDVCGNGSCRGTAVVDGASCDDRDACTATDVCVAGTCGGTPIVCNDDNPCTFDYCDSSTGCRFANLTDACDDGNVCTTGDRCGPPETSPLFEEDFDGVAGSALPIGWTTTITGPGNYWITHTGSPDTPPNSAFGKESNLPSDSAIVSPPIVATSSRVTLTFQNRWKFESPTQCRDAAVLEIKMGSGPFVDVAVAGGSFASGGYTGTVAGPFNNPLANRAAWCGTSPGYPNYVTTQVDLPANASRQPFQLKWRVGSDNSGSVLGQDIDSIVIRDSTNICNPGPVTNCDDHNPCTDDSCDSVTGCVHADHTGSCSDGNACTAGDLCDGGTCVGTSIVCDDHNPCTTDSCNPATGCVYLANTNACDDGNACTTNDICDARQYFGENFDSVTVPAVPAGWSSVVVGIGTAWATRSVGSDTAPNSAFGADNDHVADEVLESPAIAIASATAKLSFRNRWSFDGTADCYDAGVLEIKIGAGPYSDIVTAGGSFITGGYNGTVSSSYDNPLASRAAWCSASSAYPNYLPTVVNLPAAAAGQTIRLRWRLGSDTSGVAVGQDIDSIVISDSVCTGGPTRDCNDDNPCTDDSCNPASGCVHTNNLNACSDGNACTIGDLCSGGACHAGPPLSCDDNNPCTDDACNPATGCVHINNSNACNDGNACTRSDVCVNGTCVGSNPIVCTAADQCHDGGICNPATGACSGAARPDGTACDDGNLCTSGETCQSGTCTAATSGLNHPRPKSSGYYRQLCEARAHNHPSYQGDQLTDGDAGCVGRLTQTFAGISTVDDICGVVDSEARPPHGGVNHGGSGDGPGGKECDKGEDELIATALNICRARVCEAQSLDSHCHGNTHTTVSQSFADADAILDNAARDKDTCKNARCELREINNGHALEMNSLLLSVESSKVRLGWATPVLDDGSGTPSAYELWRRPLGSDDAFTKIGTTTGLTYLDATAGTTAWEYDITAVIPGN